MAELTPVDLDNTTRCPLDGRCAGCGARTGLVVCTAAGMGGVFCLTLCPSCDLPRLGPAEVARRILAHCAHLGIDSDEMATLLQRDQRSCGLPLARIEIDGTRPGGSSPGQQSAGSGFPNHLQVSEERPMLRRHSCVSIQCDQCADTPGGAEFEAHYPTEAAALDAAMSEGWQVGPAGRLWCPVCGPILTCEAEGHQFTGWHRPTALDPSAGERQCGCDPVASVHRLGSPCCAREFRYCQRCCLHESRTAQAVA